MKSIFKIRAALRPSGEKVPSSLNRESIQGIFPRMKKLKPRILLGMAVSLFLVIFAFLYFKPGRRPDIILVLVDALRADHVGAYGYERDTTPVLDGLAREGVLFTRAVSASNWTPVSIASMFSGLYATAHGMVPPTRTSSWVRLSPKIDALAEILRGAGYRTAAVTTNAWLIRDFGYAQGFDFFDYIGKRPANILTDSAIRTLAKLQKRRAPFFLYLHYTDVHHPYKPVPPYDRLFQEPLRNGRHSADIEKDVSLYDGEVRFADAEIGAFFEELRRRGLYRDAFVMVTADHGEQFMERGHEGHGNQLFMEEIHIPLIMKSGASPHAVRETVSNIDIYATILKAARLPIPENRASIPLQDEPRLRKRAGVMSEGFQAFYQRSFTTVDGKKLIMDFGSPYNPEYLGLPVGKIMAGAKVVGVFDLEKDQLEQTPLRDERLEQELRGRLEEELRLASSLKIRARKGKVSSKTLEELRSLGYLK